MHKCNSTVDAGRRQLQARVRPPRSETLLGHGSNLTATKAALPHTKKARVPYSTAARYRLSLRGARTTRLSAIIAAKTAPYPAMRGLATGLATRPAWAARLVR